VTALLPKLKAQVRWQHNISIPSCQPSATLRSAGDTNRHAAQLARLLKTAHAAAEAGGGQGSMHAPIADCARPLCRISSRGWSLSRQWVTTSRCTIICRRWIGSTHLDVLIYDVPLDPSQCAAATMANAVCMSICCCRMIREPRPVSSTACGLCLAQRGPLNFDDLHYRQRKYSSFGAYGQSKVANILFAKELAKRCGVCSSCAFVNSF